MSSTDNRIVQMQFNNREFEQGVSDTLKSIENLNKTLDTLGNGDYGKGLKLALVDVGENVDSVTSHFNALEEVVTGMLRRLGEQVADFGLEFVESLTLEMPVEGYKKYESEVEKTAGLINAAKFQGYDDPEGIVNNLLAKLQWFADATSYSYDAIVSAFLAFVNSDIPMEDAVNLILGMGAQFSSAGAVATEVGGAFNVLAKSVGKGSMIYQSAYRQLQNTFKVISPEVLQSYLDTAEALGYLTKEGDHYITTMKAFNEGISKQKGDKVVSRASLNTITGWLNGAVLQKVYAQYGWYAQQIYDIQESFSEAGGGILTLSDAMDILDKSIQDGTADFSAFGDVSDEELQKLVARSKTAFEASQEAVTFGVAIDAVKDGISSLWKSIFTDVLGNYQEAKVLFTNIQDYLLSVFGGPVEAFERLLSGYKDEMGNEVKGWKELGGRDTMLQGFRNIVTALENIVRPIKEAFREIFPPATVDTLIDLTNRFEAFTSKLIISEEAMEKIKNVASIAFKIFGFFVEVASVAVNVFKNFWSATKPVRDIFVEIFGVLAAGVNKIMDVVSSLGILENMGQQVTYFWTPLKNKLNEFWQGFTDGKTIISVIKDIYGEIEVFTIDIEGMGNAWKSVQDWILSLVDTITKWLLPKWDEFKTKVETVFTTIDGWIKSGEEGLKAFSDTIKQYVIDPLYNAFQKVKGFIETIVGGLVIFIKNIFTALSEVLYGTDNLYEQRVKKMMGGNSFISGLGELANIVFGIIAKINITKLLQSFTKMMDSLRKIPDLINSLNKPIQELSNTLKAFQKQVKADMIKTIALSVLALAGAMWIISKIDTDKLGDAFVAVGLLVGEMAIVLKALSGLEGSTTTIGKKGLKSSGGVKSFATMLLMLGAAIVLIASALKLIITAGEPNEIWTATASIAVIMGLLAAFLVIAGKAANELTPKKIANLNSIGLMILKMSSGIYIISHAIKEIGELKPEEWKQGMLGVAAILVGIGLLFAGISKINLTPAKTEAFGKAMVLLSVSIALMSGAIAILAKSDWKQLLIATGALSAIILVFAAASKFAKGGKGILQFSGALAIMGASLGLLAGGLLLLGLIPLKQLAQGLLLLVGLIASMVIVSETMGKGPSLGLLSMAGALLILGPALLGMAAGLTALGLIPFGALLQGLGAFAIILGLLVAASAFIGDFNMRLISIGVAAIGIGLGVMFAAQGLAILIGVMEAIAALAGSGIIEKAFYSIGAAAVSLFMGFLETFIENIPILITDLLAGVDLILIALFDFIQSEGFAKILGVLERILDYLPKLISEVLGLLLKLIGNLFVDIGVAIATGLLGMSEEEAREARESGKRIIEGLVEGFKEMVNKAVTAVVDLGKKLLKGLKDCLGIKSPSKETEKIANFTVEGFVKGIKEKASTAVQSMTDLGSDSLTGLKSSLSGIGSAITDDLDVESQLTITPVLDLSELQNGKGDLTSMLNDIGSTTIGTGIADPYDYDADIISQLGTLNTTVSAVGNTNAGGGIAGAIKEALAGIGVYADGTKIGKLVDRYQLNNVRASGNL